MKTFFFLCAVLLFLAPAKNEFFDDKCQKLKGRCKRSCDKTEELVAFCQKFLKCCQTLHPCVLSGDHN
ncbi:beta-defensin 106A-like [Cavia porcellus]|uniref:beta-defensin 106A-like n=1 Tax=Cavia porcellus TaxID=10141 RepID=UPI000350CD5B|nr:beta-defensin 106A-like [Cavia porcellus]